MEDTEVIGKVKMVDEGPGMTRRYKQIISRFVRFGRELKISPKANASINAPGFKTEFYVETVSVLIGIGKDHTADLIMSKEAWVALTNGAEVSITTTEEFKRDYL